jgi:hypothetical protein
LAARGGTMYLRAKVGGLIRLRTPAALLVIAASTALALVPAGASAQNPGVLSPPGPHFGKTYAEWSAAWWQRMLSIKKSKNPQFDTTGADCEEGDEPGPVFFLAGTATGERVERSCTIANGEAIFFPIVNVECSNVEEDPFKGETPEARRECAAGFIDPPPPLVPVRSLKVELDGQSFIDLDQFRTTSPDFPFTLPPNNILDLSATACRDVGGCLGTGDGYYVMLAALSPGSHELHFEGTIRFPRFSFSQNVTYRLTVES